MKDIKICVYQNFFQFTRNCFDVSSWTSICKSYFFSPRRLILFSSSRKSKHVTNGVLEIISFCEINLEDLIIVRFYWKIYHCTMGVARIFSGGGNTYRKFWKYFLRKLWKMHYLAYFSKDLTDHALNYCVFGRKMRILGEF